MIDLKEFDAVQTPIEEGSSDRTSRAPATYLLSGLIRSGKCLSPMCGHTRRKGKRAYRYYVCNASQHKGKGYCAGTNVNADRLEEAVIAKVRDQATGHRSVVTTKGAPGAIDAAETERRGLVNAVERLKYKSSRLFELYEDGLMDKGEFRDRMAALSAERGELKAWLEAATMTVTDPPRPPLGDWDSLEDDGRRGLLRVWTREEVVQGTAVDLVLAGLADRDEAISASVRPVRVTPARSMDG